MTGAAQRGDNTTTSSIGIHIDQEAITKTEEEVYPNKKNTLETRYTSENTENASRGRNDEIRQEKGNHVVIVGGKEKNAVLYVASRYI